MPKQTHKITIIYNHSDLGSIPIESIYFTSHSIESCRIRYYSTKRCSVITIKTDHAILNTQAVKQFHIISTQRSKTPNKLHAVTSSWPLALYINKAFKH